MRTLPDRVAVTPEATAATAAQVMLGEKVKRLPVVDDTGRLAGIVSRADVLGAEPHPGGQAEARGGSGDRRLSVLYIVGLTPKPPPNDYRLR